MRRTYLSALALILGGSLAFPQADLRSHYDAQTYRLDLRVDPVVKTLSGTVGVVAKVSAPRLDTFELDLMGQHVVERVNQILKPLSGDSSMAGPNLAFKRDGDRIKVSLAKPAKKGDEVRIAVTYKLTSGAGRQGIRFGTTPDNKPWITTSCQGIGAHSWWPCKGENFHPEDKFAHLFMNITVPKGLMAVCNGRLVGRKITGDSETFRWQHDYPCHNYSVALNVAPYVEVKSTISLSGIAKPTPFIYYVLPQDVEKAKVQFTDVEPMLRAFGEAFGPYPFPGSKFGLVQTDYWGMEHSTVVAYGNSWPKWLKIHGGTDRYEFRNRFFDYILIHEVAHEWWANGVSAADWGHLWIHEGFATYAEGVYMEKIFGRKAGDDYFDKHIRPQANLDFKLFRGAGVLPSQAFNNNVYFKGAMVLNMLRHYVNDDDAWWRSLRTFNMRFRYKSAVTEDFIKALNEVTKKDWKRFFDEWFYNPGHPTLKGKVFAEGNKVVVEIENTGSQGSGFHVPIDLTWSEGGRPQVRRVTLSPGANRVEIPTSSVPTAIAVLNLNRLAVKAEISW